LNDRTGGNAFSLACGFELTTVYNANMPLRLNRRRWVAFLGATPLLAQIAPQSAAPALPPEQRIAKAQSDVHEVSGKLAALEVPMNIEPAFHFRA
jgi:hypothetical protein